MFRYTKWTFVREVITILGVAILMIPLLIVLFSSFKSRREISESGALAPPADFTVDNFLTLFRGTAGEELVSGLINSVIVTSVAIFGLVFLGALAAYVVSRRIGKRSTVAYSLFVVGIVLPAQLGLIPLYIGARTIGLTSSIWGMGLQYVGMFMPLAVFLYAGFFRTLPREYEEAATIDGATRFQVFRHVVLPLMAPATGTVAILTGLIVWNDFFTPLIFLNGSGAETLPVVMYNFVGALLSKWDLIFPFVIVSMIPILIFYLAAQKHFIKGFAGGLKS